MLVNCKCHTVWYKICNVKPDPKDCILSRKWYPDDNNDNRKSFRNGGVVEHVMRNRGQYLNLNF